MPNQHKRDYRIAGKKISRLPFLLASTNVFFFHPGGMKLFGHIKSFVTIEFLLVMHVWSVINDVFFSFSR